MKILLSSKHLVPSFIISEYVTIYIYTFYNYIKIKYYIVDILYFLESGIQISQEYSIENRKHMEKSEM